MHLRAHVVVPNKRDLQHKKAPTERAPKTHSVSAACEMLFYSEDEVCSKLDLTGSDLADWVNSRVAGSQ